MQQNFKEHIIQLLLQDERVKDEQDELRGNLVKEYVNTLDEKLIALLLEDTQTRTKFFLKIKDAYVFKTNEFKFFLDENSIDNSFTQYSNRIGLSSGGKFLKDNTDVVLNFPFKDCILEGGQSTEDGLDTYFEYDEKQDDYIEKQSKRKEIFFNEVLARDEIDRLLEPKAFTNITKYDNKGKSKPTKFNRNSKGTITDNLIIKGNNLLALKSLEKEFKGKVKLIYIDPPYNTGNDSFAYNDNFNHSTWLTFMRNRLVVARELLREDGVIFVQCDDNEQAYLNILLDEIFESDNFLNQISAKMKQTSGASGGGEDKRLKKNIEYLIIYSKNKFLFDSFNPLYDETNLYKAIQEMRENGKSWKYTRVIISGLKERVFLKEIYDGSGEPIKIYSHNNIVYKTIKELMKQDNLTEEQCYFKYYDKVFRDTNAQSSIRLRVMKATKNQGDFFSIDYIPQSGRNKNKMTTLYYKGNNCDLIAWLSDISVKRRNNLVKLEKVGTFWDGFPLNNLTKEGGIKFPNGKKPEALLQKIINLTTSKNDIILDFHLGSGTTGAVAHKMNRQYIGIEQLNYGENDSVIRLQNVIGKKTAIEKKEIKQPELDLVAEENSAYFKVEFDQSGISKSVNWQGGGSFVYLELAKNNQTAKEEILKCKSLKELIQYFEIMYKKYFLHYNVRIKQFKEEISQEENFKKLSLERQKEIFAKMLDLNQLYVNLSEMEDSRYKIGKEDIALTKDFYQVKK